MIQFGNTQINPAAVAAISDVREEYGKSVIDVFLVGGHIIKESFSVQAASQARLDLIAALAEA